MNAPGMALEGVRVLDLTQGVAGPYCTMLMAAQGADVVKVEPPGGDWIRNGRTQVRGHAPAAIATNVGKRSIVLDLKKPAALQVARQIARGCDVVIESYRPGVVERLGLDARTLQDENPSLVYCSITGFGREGKLSGRAVIDHVAQAYSGWMHVNADADGTPQRTRNVVLADQITGLYAFQAVASALLRKFRFGAGARLDVTLAGSMAAFLAPRIISGFLSDGQVGNAEFTAPTGDYATRDGIVVIAVQRPADVERLCAALARTDLLQDERFATPAARRRHAQAMRAELAPSLLSKTALEWERLLTDQGLMVCAARDVMEFLASQERDELGLVESIELPGVGPCPVVSIPGASRWQGRSTPAHIPRVGENTEEILRDFGIAADALNETGSLS